MADSATFAANNVLVIGATGTIGREIFKKLLEAKNSFHRLVIFTSPSTAATKAAELDAHAARGVEVCVGDVTDEADILRAYEGIDTVISAVGRDVITAQIPLIKLAERSPSVQWFIPSEYGTDVEYDASSAHEYTHQAKLQVRACLRETRDLKYTLIVTGPYADAKTPAFFGSAFPDPRMGTYKVKARKAVLMGDGDDKISFTTTSDVGKLVVAVLHHPQACHNKALRVNSFTTTPAQILAEFERQCGGEKWQVTSTPTEEVLRLEREAVTNKSPWFSIYTLRRIWLRGGTLYEKRDNDLIGLDGEGDMDTLADAVRLAIQYQAANDS